MQIFQDLNDSGLTIVLVTHEPDIAQFAKRTVVFRDGKIRHDDPVKNRPRAAEVLRSLPTVDELKPINHKGHEGTQRESEKHLPQRTQRNTEKINFGDIWQ